MPTILFVTELQPYPPYGGELIRCYNVIDSLSQHFSVIVLAPQIDAGCKLAAQVTAWYCLPPYSRALPSKINNFIYRFVPRTSWADCLRRVCQQHKPQVIWFASHHWGQYAAIARQWSTRTVMETYNVQSELTRQEYQTMPFGRAYIIRRLRHWAQCIHEQRLFPQFDRIVSVSEADRRYHAQFVGDKHSVLIPNYVNKAHYILKEPVERADSLVTMTGNFDAFQNDHGLDWFLRQVWPQVRRQISQVQLQIIGRGSDRLCERLHLSPNVTCIGETPTVAPYLRQAAIAAIPLLHGSGTRFKILEALACETAVVSTTLGAQGLDLVSGESIILADSGPDFVQAIVNLLRNRLKRTWLAQNGLDILKSQYSFDVNTQRIRQFIIEMLAK